MDAIINRGCLLAATLLAFLLRAAQADINMQGCTEAFFRMTCADDDILQVTDVRFAEVDESHPCTQKFPVGNLSIPKQLVHTCSGTNDSTATPSKCLYAEEICAGKSDCTFYVSPHLIGKKEKPNVNSEVIIKYKCLPGNKRKGEIGFAALVATVSILSMLFVGGLLLWRLLTQDTSTYADFANERRPPQTNQMSPSASSAVNYGSSISGSTAAGTAPATSGAKPSVSFHEDISVELRSPSSGNPVA